MKTIPIDGAGRVVLPKDVRSRLNLHGGDLLEVETGPECVTLRVVHTVPARIVPHGGRAVWDAPAATATEKDFMLAIERGRHERG